MITISAENARKISVNDSKDKSDRINFAIFQACYNHKFSIRVFGLDKFYERQLKEAGYAVEFDPTYKTYSISW